MEIGFLATSLVAHALSAFDAFSAPDKPFFWQSWIFLKDNWEPTVMRPIRYGLPLVTGLLLIAEWRAKHTGETLTERWKQRIGVLLTCIAFGAYYDFGNPNTRYADYYHRHEFFHYYTGSKYSREVGYTRLYECSAIAEIENGRGDAVRKRDLRDLRVNLIRPIEDTYVVSDPDECKKHFTPARWEAFRKDIDWFYKSAAGSYWENMWKDHGYNPTPVWTMTGKLFASFGPANDTFFKTLAGIDILFQLGAVLLLRWAFGWRGMMIATVFWGVNAPANFYWTGGAFIRMDWIFLLVAALCFAKKRMFILAGAALTWSSLLRVFPMVMFAGWGIVIGMYVLNRFRHHRNEVRLGDLSTWMHRDHRRLIGGCVVAGGLLIPTSVITTGPDSWHEFYEHTLKTHNTTPLTNHMGLESVLTHTWKGRMRFTRDDNLDDPFAGWKLGRIERFKQRQMWRWLIIGAAFAWTAWALRRTKQLWIAMPFGLTLTVLYVNLTCYYYSMFMIAVAIALVRPKFAPAYLAVSAASQMLLDRYYFVDDKYVAQTYLFIVLCVLMLYSYSRPFSMDRLRAWWDGKPEPRPQTPAERTLTQSAAPSSS
ncbi:MAG: hypothetical protein JW751_19490 [Polyangiaceae bacterium]|nr:hypothetical protein [Polyangiaceae bacterium]